MRITSTPFALKGSAPSSMAAAGERLITVAPPSGLRPEMTRSSRAGVAGAGSTRTDTVCEAAPWRTCSATWSPACFVTTR